MPMTQRKEVAENRQSNGDGARERAISALQRHVVNGEEFFISPHSVLGVEIIYDLVKNLTPMS